ncbi:MAG: LexA family transcriptional regulator [Pseudomonadota bacterium]
MSKPISFPPERDVGARLKRARVKLGLTGEEMARRVEVSRPYWSALENGKRTPGPKLLSALERVFALRPEYVTTGSGPMFSRFAPASQQVDESAGRALVASEARAPWPERAAAGGRWVLALPSAEGATAARRYEVLPSIPALPASAKRRRGGPAADKAGDIAFSQEWLRRHLGHTSGQLATLQVQGDAMLPALHDGDTVVVDTGAQRVEASGIYVIALRGDRLVRRVQPMLDGSLVIASDNPAYGKETVPAARAQRLEVVGRVVWPRLA